MAISKETEKLYTKFLYEELIPAMGCTEPIALAYGAAYARRLLGKVPTKYTVECSGNIIKNVKAVTVPQTNGMRGIQAAVLVGALGGDPDLELEVLSSVTPQDLEAVKEAAAADIVTIKPLDTTHTLHIIIREEAGEDWVSVEIIDSHNNLGNIYHNGKLIHERGESDTLDNTQERACLNLADILEYADTVDLEEVREILERQLAYNTAISNEGLTNPWGARVGQTLLKCRPNDLVTKAKAAAAAGSDARMNGCTLPVVINSGSGNQGITVSMPVRVYAEELGVSHEKLLRALCVANLTAIHQKTSVGRLSAFCGALSAATGAAVGIAYLEDASYEVMAQTITNSLCDVGGMVCDGAKSSCAAKIASSVECALLGYDLAKQDLGFRKGEGIVKDNVEDTIAAVGRMAACGMRETDREILDIMVE